VASKTTGKSSARASSSRKAPSSKARSASKKPAAARSVASVKKKTKRKALTIKEPPRRKPPTEAQGKSGSAAGKEAAAGKGGARARQAESGLLKGKKTRTVAEAASEHKADAKGYVFINGRRVRMISTKGHVPTKKARPEAANNNAGSAMDEQIAIKAIKTKLGRKELNEYRELLLTKRRQLVGDLNAMEDSALRSGGGNLSHMPIHMADIGTDTFDQDFTLSLAENERQQLREIDQALQRIQDNTYGVCQMTGKPIPKARLDAKPWAKYTVEAARMIEGQWSR
jgi:DnaK suppressor protein